MVIKRKRKLEEGRTNLKRFKDTVRNYTESNEGGGAYHTDAEHYFRKHQQGQMTRKEKRKESRGLKKMRKNAFKQGKPLPSIHTLEEERALQLRADKKRLRQQRKRRNRAQRSHNEEKEKQEAEEYKKQSLLVENEKEDKAIKQLGKLLGLNKRKNKKTLPQSFIDDGLDYLLECTDSEKMKLQYEGNDDDLDLDLASSDDDYHIDKDDEDLSDASDAEKTGSDHDEAEVSENDSENDSKIDKMAEVIKGILKTKKEKTKKSVTFSNNKEVGGNEEEKEESSCKAPEPSTNYNSSDDGDDNNSDDDDHDDDDNNSDDDDSDGSSDGGDLNSEDDEDDIQEEDNKNEDETCGKEQDKNINDIGDRDTMDSDGYKEDIYGRLRDREGNIVTEELKSGTYVPPSKRLELAQSDDAKKKLQLEKIKKQLKGFLNRLSESNIHNISQQIEDMYRCNSRADVSETLTGILLDGCSSVAAVPERILQEQALLIAILHGNIGSEVGAIVLQKTAEQFNVFYQQGGQYGDGKEMINIVSLLCYLFYFNVLHCELIFNVLIKFVDSFGEKDIEVILVVLKCVGFGLRKEDPQQLKDVILKIQTKANSINASQFHDPARVKFMIEILMAVKNNNMRKIPNYDPSHMDHLKKMLRTISSGAKGNQLKIPLDDLLNAKQKGRWWFVGSAWAGRQNTTDIVYQDDGPHSVPGNVSNKILELAKKQRMNTDIRKNIFCLIMTGEDFVDVFEKLLRLNLKQQEREIIHVIVDLCIQEKKPNPFYSYLAQKFCEYHRRFQMTVQCSMWDKLKEMHSLNNKQILNLAKFLTHLIATKALSLSVFKTLEFSELDKSKMKFLHHILQSLLVDNPDYIVKEIFGRVASIPKLKIMREGLKLFMHHFILRNNRTNSELKERIDLAEKAMMSASNSFSL